MIFLANIRAWRQERRTDRERSWQMPAPLPYVAGEGKRLLAELCPDEVDVPVAASDVATWNDYEMRQMVDEEFVRQVAVLVAPRVRELLDPSLCAIGEGSLRAGAA